MEVDFDDDDLDTLRSGRAALRAQRTRVRRALERVNDLIDCGERIVEERRRSRWRERMAVDRPSISEKRGDDQVVMTRRAKNSNVQFWGKEALSFAEGTKSLGTAPVATSIFSRSEARVRKSFFLSAAFGVPVPGHVAVPTPGLESVQENRKFVATALGAKRREWSLVEDEALRSAFVSVAAASGIDSKMLCPLDAAYELDWEQISSMLAKSKKVVAARSPEECRARWVNHASPAVDTKSEFTVRELQLLGSSPSFTAVARAIFDHHASANRLCFRPPSVCLQEYKKMKLVDVVRFCTQESEVAGSSSIARLGKKVDWTLASNFFDRKHTASELQTFWEKKSVRGQKRMNETHVEWSSDLDNRLDVACSIYGTTNWQAVSDFLGRGIDAKAASARFSLRGASPAWSTEQDMRVSMGLRICGENNFADIAAYVPGKHRQQIKDRKRTIKRVLSSAKYKQLMMMSEK